MLDRESARALVERALTATDADDGTARVREARRDHLRFANNQVTTAGTDRDLRLTVTVSYGARSGTAAGNPRDDDGIVAVVRAAEALARVAPEDPEHVPSPGRQTYAAADAWRDTERPDAMVNGCARVVGRAVNAGLLAAGYAESTRAAVAVATKRGAFAFRRASHAGASATVRTPSGDGSGWAADAALEPGEIAWDALAARAAEKAERSAGAQPLEPGRYPTLFEPSAVAQLADLLRYDLDQRRTDEGRSFLSRPGGASGLGEKLFPAWMNVASNPADPRAPAATFDDDGLPHMPTLWVLEGAIARLPCDRAWAAQRKKGHQLAPPNWLMTGREGSVEDLIARTERGVLVSSLWYIRSVDPRTLLHTGLTRDGVWWIEGGQVARPLRNLRWNDSPLGVFGRALDASAPARAVGRGGSGDTVVPAILTQGFHFTSASDAI